jgi:hypothetical protein
MRVIKSESGFLAYQKIFKYIHSNHYSVVVWQFLPETQKRAVSESKLNSYHLESKQLHFALSEMNDLNQKLPLFCYSEEGQFIFKSNILDIKQGVFSVALPEEVKLLEDPDVKVIRDSSGVDLSPVWKVKRLKLEDEPANNLLTVKSMRERTNRDQEFLNKEFGDVSLDEEDKLFADKRESPRTRAKEDKFVQLLTESFSEPKILKLFDLSRGGIGFLTSDPELFPKGSRIRVVGIGEFLLDYPFIGEVMSHRPINEQQNEFKVGCKFYEGQE